MTTTTPDGTPCSDRREAAAGSRPSPPSGRLTDLTRLAPAYIDVGDLDFFRDEIIAYAAATAKADEPVELHVHPSFFA